MKYFSLLAFIILTACSQPKDYLVEQVKDGDTLVVSINGKSETVQLLGIDAPENTENPKLNLDINKKGMNKADLLTLGNLATDYLKAVLLLSDNRVDLQGDLSQRDKYGRIPMLVFGADALSLNEKMVAEGYAIVLNSAVLEPNFKTKLNTFESQAIKYMNGLWRSHRNLAQQWAGKTSLEN